MQPKRRSTPPPGARQIGETELGWNIHDKDYGLKVTATIETFTGQAYTNVGSVSWQDKDGWHKADCSYHIPARTPHPGYRVLVWMGTWLLWTEKVGSVREGIEAARSYVGSQLVVSSVKPGTSTGPVYDYGEVQPVSSRQMEMEWQS